ncbi:MAG: 4-(cytidine 5'-diphospho)-2-C-methyl-D-erythritol kinase [Marmoricola sp.]
MSAVVPLPAPEAITVRAAAKINLQLSVGPLRGDGFHPLATVYQAIGLYDDITVESADEWSLLVRSHDALDLSGVPTDDTNIALRAARALTAHHGLDRAASILIDKTIPVAGGLAGGSADAAATLVGLDRLWKLDTSDADLLALAASLGSDVPFALIGGTAVGLGRGELVEPVIDNGAWWWVVAESDLGLSTPHVYAEFDKLVADASTPQIDQELVDALSSADIEKFAARLANDLQEPALHLRPDLREVLDVGDGHGALRSIISGSGPTCLFLCADHDSAVAIRQGLFAEGIERVQVAPGPVAGAHVVDYA